MLNLERLREQINEQLPLWDQSSMGLGIVKDGEILMAEGFGLRDIENNIPADGDTCTRSAAAPRHSPLRLPPCW